MKFKTAKIGTEVYNSKIGKGTIAKVEEHRIITVHNKKTFVWTLEGEGIIGPLHYFGKTKESD